jgi:hypothetical protein
MFSSADNPPPLPTLKFSTAVTATDHGQIIALVAWLCFTAGILLSLVRLYIRWPLNRLAGKDDVTYAVSALFAIVQTSIIINAVSNGLGRTESELEGKQVIHAAKVSLPIFYPAQVSSTMSPLVVWITCKLWLPHPMGPMSRNQSCITGADLPPGHLRNRSHLPRLHLDRQTLRILPLHPPRPRI